MQAQQLVTSSTGKTVQCQERHYYSLGGRVRELNDADDVSERRGSVFTGITTHVQEGKNEEVT